MKKFIITIITVIAVATVFTSCNGNQRAIDSLTRMQDSIQSQIDWRVDVIQNELNSVDSIINSDDFKYRHDEVEYRLLNVKNLQEEVRENKAKVDAIQIEIAKLQ